MLSGFIEYYKQPEVKKTSNQVQTMMGEKHWPKKYCEKLIEKKKKEGYIPNAKVSLKLSKKLLTLIGFKDIPEDGYRFFHYSPPLVFARNEFGTTLVYRFDELELVDTNTGEILC